MKFFILHLYRGTLNQKKSCNYFNSVTRPVASRLRTWPFLFFFSALSRTRDWILALYKSIFSSSCFIIILRPGITTWPRLGPNLPSPSQPVEERGLPVCWADLVYLILNIKPCQKNGSNVSLVRYFFPKNITYIAFHFAQVTNWIYSTRKSSHKLNKKWIYMF